MIPVMPFQNSANIRVCLRPGFEIKPVKRRGAADAKERREKFPA